jgi:hypothetical protein
MTEHDCAMSGGKGVMLTRLDVYNMDLDMGA